MAVKSITITTEAYDALASHKGPHESFTDVILRTYKPTKGRSPLWDLVGMLSKEEGDAMERRIEEMRNRSDTELRKRLTERNA